MWDRYRQQVKPSAGIKVSYTNRSTDRSLVYRNVRAVQGTRDHSSLALYSAFLPAQVDPTRTAAGSSILPHSFERDLYPFHKNLIHHRMLTGIDSSPRNLLRIQPCVESNKMRLSSMGDSHELCLRHTLRASLLWLARCSNFLSAKLNPCSLQYNPVQHP